LKVKKEGLVPSLLERVALTVTFAVTTIMGLWGCILLNYFFV